MDFKQTAINIFWIFRGTSLLHVDKAYNAEFSLVLSFSMWPEKDNWSFINISRNLTVISGHVWPASLLQLNHCSAFKSSLFACFIRFKESEPEIWKVESSAKRRVNKLVAFAKSFIKKRNNNGPRQLPCGIPE